MEFWHVLWFSVCTNIAMWRVIAAARKDTGGTNRIPIGTVYEADSIDLQTALKFKIEYHNNYSSPNEMKIDQFPKTVNHSDTVDITSEMCSIIFKGVFAFYGTMSSESYSAIMGITDRMHMPYISASTPTANTYNPSDYILYIRPDYGQAMIDVIRHFKWHRVFYLYDNNEGLERLDILHNTVQSEDLKISIESVHLSDIPNSYEKLRYVGAQDASPEKYIVLDLSTTEGLKSILEQVLKVGMNNGNYHYLLGGLVMDELDLSDFVYSGVNMTGFRVLQPTKDATFTRAQQEWENLDPNVFHGAGPTSAITLDVALTMDAVTLFLNSIKKMVSDKHDVFRNVWVRGEVRTTAGETMDCFPLPTPWMHGTKIVEAMKGVNFSGVTGYVKFDSRGFRTDYSLQVMELSLYSEPNKVGEWTTVDGLTMQTFRQPPTTAAGKNNTVIITTIESAPYLMWKTDQEEDGTPLVGNDRFEGYCAELAQELAKKCKFSYTLKLVNDGMYGALKDGQWNGMVGELSRYEADLALAPLSISSQRERIIDFSKPFMNLGISIMIKKPEKQKPGVFSFMDPLSSEIWICIIMAYLGVSVILFLVSRFSPYEWQIEDSINGPSFTNDFTLLNSLWFALGAFMQQGCDISPRSLSGRVVGSVWWFFTLILISSYTANLAAFLTVERMLTPIESAEDLSEQTEIQYGTLRSGSTMAFFKDSNVDVYERMWDFMKNAKPSVFENETKQGVERVRNSKGKYAFLLESTMNEYYNQRKPCNTMKVGTNLDSKGYGIATPRGSPWREKINLAVLKLREDGVLQKLKKRWWYDKGECNAEAEGGGSSTSALTLSNVAGIFYILIGGLGFSMLVSLLEFLYKSKVEAKRQQKAVANSFRNKARMSVRGADHENGGYTYTAPSQIINYEKSDYYDSTHTQV